MHHKKNKERLQAPGSSALIGRGKRGEISTRITMGNLDYLQNMSGGVDIEQYEKDLPNFLEKYYSVHKNKRVVEHAIRTSAWWGLVDYSPRGKRVTASFSGKKTLRFLKSNNKYDLADMLCSNAKSIVYPNSGTMYVSSKVTVKPVSLMMYYLKKYKELPKTFFTNTFPYIINEKVFKVDINDLTVKSSPYTQMYSYVVGSFVALGVLKEIGGMISISNPQMKEIIDNYYSEDEMSLFRDDCDIQLSGSINNRAGLNNLLPNLVFERDNYTCRFTGIRSPHLNSKGKPLCVMHHLIPIEYRPYYLIKCDFDIDCIDCGTTAHNYVHDIIHFSPESKLEYLHKSYDELLPDYVKTKLNLNKEQYFKLFKVDLYGQTSLSF